jgi:hypothetical protein
MSFNTCKSYYYYYSSRDHAGHVGSRLSCLAERSLFRRKLWKYLPIFFLEDPPIVPSPGECSQSVVCNIATALILQLFAEYFLINLHLSNGLSFGLLEKLRGCSHLHRNLVSAV